jgi:hypothetical protein
MSLRYGETIERISTGRQTKINKVIAKLITDDEKQTIATLHPSFTAIRIQDGDYVVNELIKLLKGKRSFQGKLSDNKGTYSPGLLPKLGEVNHGHLKCHFCHTLGHIKPNWRKWLALQTSDIYKQRNSHEPKYQLIYDHLEDSILAPRSCPYCSDEYCDGSNCESPFDYEDYNEASMFFTQTLSSLVVNAKLERPLDSHAPQTEQVYWYDDDDWGKRMRTKITMLVNGKPRMKESEVTRMRMYTMPKKRSTILKWKPSLNLKTNMMKMIKMATCDIRAMRDTQLWKHKYQRHR